MHGHTSLCPHRHNFLFGPQRETQRRLGKGNFLISGKIGNSSSSSQFHHFGELWQLFPPSSLALFSPLERDTFKSPGRSPVPEGPPENALSPSSQPPRGAAPYGQGPPGRPGGGTPDHALPRSVNRKPQKGEEMVELESSSSESSSPRQRCQHIDFFFRRRVASPPKRLRHGGRSPSYPPDSSEPLTNWVSSRQALRIVAATASSLGHDPQSLC
ncbi:hypothetical protein GWK47_028970 [Chionoecetes opilio]|uniref:Uncharacterized protein n=1 Tax=Chionoecetes opilio TaxID=41210 RepID=A0A8J4YSU9_CHIOP|nr:hypothetical protein GWK47_028970 [Chionoecetes opilio]